MPDSGSTRFSFQYYADANYSTLHNLWARLALQDMYIDWGTRPPRLLAPRRGTIFEFESPAVLRLPLQLVARPHVKEPSWPV